MPSSKVENKSGLIECTRIVSYDEVLPYIKNNQHSIEEAIKILMKNEQDEWKKNNTLKDPESGVVNIDFFKDCFPRWVYKYNGKNYSLKEMVGEDLLTKVTWDMQLKVEHDPKLKAYILLKNERKRVK